MKKAILLLLIIGASTALKAQKQRVQIFFTDSVEIFCLNTEEEFVGIGLWKMKIKTDGVPLHYIIRAESGEQYNLIVNRVGLKQRYFAWKPEDAVIE